MFEIKVNGHIAAAHQLRGYDGPCKNVHGHTWKIEVTLSSEKLDAIGMVTDFKVLKKILADVTDPLDHVFLNDLPYFKDVNPTTENIAKYVYQHIAPVCAPLRVKQVEVWESERASVCYYE